MTDIPTLYNVTEGQKSQLIERVQRFDGLEKNPLLKSDLIDEAPIQKEPGFIQNVLSFDENKNVPNENSSAQDVFEYNKKLREKSQLKLALSTMAYKGQIDVDKGLEDSKIAETLNIDPSIINDNNRENFAYQALMQNYNNLIDKDGLLPDEVMTDINFLKYASADDYNFMTRYRDLIELSKGEEQTISRAFNFSKEEGKTDIQFDKDLDKEKLFADKFKNAYLYSRSYDSTLFDVSRVLSDQVTPFVNEPGRIIPLAGAITLSSILGAPGAGVALGNALSTVDYRFKQYRSQLVAQALQENPNLNLDTAQQQVGNTAGLMALLDLSSDAVAIGLGAGIAKTFKALTKTVKTGAKSSVTMSLAKRFQKSSTEMFKDFSLVFGAEVGTEAIQGGMQRYAINKVNENLTWENVIYDGLKGGQEAFTVAGILSALGAGIKGVGTFANLTALNTQVQAIKAQVAISDSTNMLAKATLMSETPLNKKDPTKLASILDKIDDRKVFVKAKDLYDYTQANGIEIESLGKDYVNLENTAKSDPDKIVSFNESLIYTTLNTNNVGDIISRVKTDAAGLSLNEAKNLIKDVDVDQLITAIKDRVVKTQEEQKVKADVYSYLIEHNPNVDPKKADRLAGLFTNFYSSLSDMTGLSISEIYNLERINIDTMKQETSLGSNTDIDEIFTDEVNAYFSPDTMEVVLTEDSSFQSVLHEMAHGFLQVIANIHSKLQADPSLIKSEESKEKFNAFYNNLLQGMGGIFNDLNSLETGYEKTKVQEIFVNKFLQAVLDPNVDMQFKSDFKRWLSNAIQKELALIPDTGNKVADHQMALSSYLERNYGFENTGINSEFMEFVSNIATNERADATYPSIINEGLFNKELNNPNLDVETRKEIEDIQKQYNDVKVETTREREKIDRILFELDPKKVTDRSKYRKFLKENKDLTKRQDFTIKELEERYDQLFKKISSQIDASLASAESKTLSLYKINKESALRFLTKDEVAILEQKGLVNNDGFLIEQVSEEVYHNRISKTKVAKAFLYQALNKNELNYYKNTKTIDDVKKEIKQDVIVSQEIRNYYVERRLSLGKAEYNLFSKLTKRNRTSTGQIMMVAKIDVMNTSYRDLNVNTILRQANEYRALSMKALAEGRIDLASQYNQKEFLYSCKAKIALETKKNINKSLASHTKFFKSKERFGQTDEVNYDNTLIAIGNEVLVRAGLIRTTAKHKQNLEYVKNNDPGKYDVYSRILKLNMPYYENILIQDLVDMADELSYLKTSASFLKHADNKRDKETLATQVNEMVGTLDENDRVFNKDTSKKVEGYTKNKRFSILDGIMIHIGKMETICKWLDGKELGAFFNYVYRPIRQASDKYLVKNAEYRIKAEAVLKNYSKHVKNQKNGVIETKKWLGFDLGLGDDTKGNGRIELLGIVSHLGNTYNKQALIASLKNRNPNFNEQVLQDFLDAMIEQGWIDEEMMNTVQSFWDMNEEVFTLAQDAFNSINGHPMVKQERNTINTPWGRYAGGYMPLLREKDAAVGADYEVLDIKEFQKQVQATVNHNFTITRTAFNGDNAVVINIQKLVKQGEKVIRYGTLQPSVIQVQKVLNNKQLAQRLDEAHPDLREKVFNPWLKAVANDQRTTHPENFRTLYAGLSYFKKMAGAMVMAFNLNNIIQGSSQFSSLLTTTKAEYLAKASQNLVLNRAELKFRAETKSDFMKTRLKENVENVDMQFQNNFIVPTAKGFNKNSIAQKIKYIHNHTLNNAYIGQQIFQREMDLIAWNAKYEQCIDSGMSEADAVALADSNVRETSSSFNVVDTANIERASPWVQIMTQFGNYFWTMANLYLSRSRMASKETRLNGGKSIQSLIAKLPVAFTSVILPSIIAEAINKTFTQTWGEEDEGALFDSTGDVLLGAPARTIFAMVPFFGTTLTQFYNEAILNKNNYTNSNFNIASVTVARQGIGQLLDLKKDIDKGWTYKDSRDLGMLLALVSGIPQVAFATKIAGVWADLINENIRPVNSFDVLMSITQGRPSADATK